jgi:Flp pilus assembly pilin Flp
MLMLLNLVLPMFQKVRNERGVVSVEWIILGAVIMAAIVLAFAPTFQTALTSAVTAISGQLQANVAAGGS